MEQTAPDSTSTMEETRSRYGEVLEALARRDRNVVALDCDLGRSTKSYRITEVDKTRFIEMGIAEQDMVSTAAGLANMGKKVFANSFAIFITGRAFDQIRQQLALPNLHVVLCGSSGGITQGPDGATHQSVLDIGLMRLLPNMTVFNPADADQTEDVVTAAYESDGPVYIRLSRFPTVKNIPDHLRFSVGKGQVLKRGGEIALCGTGPLMQEVNAASEVLARRGIETGVVNFHTIKPFDNELVAGLMKEYKYIVAVEEHSTIGGLGTVIAESMAEQSLAGACTLIRHGMRDRFGESGTATDLLTKYRLDAAGIVETVIELCSSR